MAINPNTIKALFSKLGGAAKKALPLADDAAAAVANYGDDAARMAFANVDDLAAATAQSDDIANIISKENSILNSAPVKDPVLWDNDYLEWYDDKGINTDFRLNGVRTPPENTDELIAHLNNTDAELDSLSQLDPDAYKSGLDGTPDLDSTVIDPLRFPGHNPQLVGSFTYPDGFYDPDGAAMYYDSLERGYIPEEYAYVDYFSHAEPAYHPVHGQVRKRIDNQVSNRITHNTHAPAKTSMDVNNPVHRGILDDYYEYLSNYSKDITPRDPVFLSKYPYRYHYPWEGKY